LELIKLAQENMSKLERSRYPGRGIVIGCTPDADFLIQIYWIMGRSENSRNRIFIKENNGFVRTKAYDETKVKDPSLIIYYPIKHYENYHIVSNGDQTETILNTLIKGGSFEDAINQREFEPDKPHFTPRISGLIDLKKDKYLYKLSIVKSINNNPEYLVRHFYNYANGIPGIGYCITTYIDDSDPLPSFAGEPCIVKVLNTIDENISSYWEILNNDNLISMLVKSINAKTGEFNIKIRNKRQSGI
jgi:IMP cyclohydrolase